ncbi:MAG: hypothetical protein KJ757_05660 [Planctomycetes bacterium]|nr:hypothetical protein [Planctomycetota bacterium]MBU1517689.1 hypothetical protein [Planctomycetota bacterium]MBU2458484.1 hypothetical protein [Planctomycetota bacterium]MBU2597026.1 hypothetical protein [Planctomycetota bacterium]
MLPQILALTITEAGGDKVEIGAWPFIIGALPFIVAIVFIVMLTWYFLNKKRLEHQQILAAIEKGTPLSELRPVVKKGADWIKSLTAGIAFLFIGLELVFVVLFFNKFSDEDTGVSVCKLLAVALAITAIGIAGIIRGILQRKTEKALSADESALDANHGQ